MDNPRLPPDLEQLAADAVAFGRYPDRAEVLRANVDLLKRQDLARAEFIKSPENAEAKSERDAWLSIDEVHFEMTFSIEETQRSA